MKNCVIIDIEKYDDMVNESKEYSKLSKEYNKRLIQKMDLELQKQKLIFCVSIKKKKIIWLESANSKRNHLPTRNILTRCQS